MMLQLATDERRSQSDCILTRDLTEMLRNAVQIPCIGIVLLGIATLGAAENTVRAEVNNPTSPFLHNCSNLMWQQGVKGYARNGLLSLSPLLNRSNAIHNNLRTELAKDS